VKKYRIVDGEHVLEQITVNTLARLV